MLLSDFDYLLPDELIAVTPSSKRDESRLLVVEQEDSYQDLIFKDIINFINPGDLVIFNDSKVIKARLFGNKVTGGRVELLIERILDERSFIAHVRTNKTINVGLKIILPNNLMVEVVQRNNDLFVLQACSSLDMYLYLEQYGNIPLPPYIERASQEFDNKRYQTVYASTSGSVAAPTAGLHFTEELLNQIKNKEANIAYVTLHVGAGTFKPVMTHEIEKHKMHSERYVITQDTIDAIKATREKGGRIIAVGTTTLRVLESVAQEELKAKSGETDIFIIPGFKFKVVDKLITNFHLPKSTLLMLVSAFAGRQTIWSSYEYAIKNRYRFYSYGDAMLLSRV